MDKHNNKRRIELALLSALLVTLIVIGTVFYHLVEGFSFVNSFYLTSVTLTTVGYGDFAPVTDAGKIFTAIYSFMGVGTFLAFAASLLGHALESFRRIRNEG